MRDDLPLPETPVSTVRRWSGKLASMFLRLLAWQDLRLSQADFSEILGSFRRGREGCLRGWARAVSVAEAEDTRLEGTRLEDGRLGFATVSSGFLSKTGRLCSPS